MRRREHMPGFKKCQMARYASRYSDRTVNGCTRALPAVRCVLGHQVDSVVQSSIFRFVDYDVWKFTCFL
jgi:hypothetical protein